MVRNYDKSTFQSSAKTGNGMNIGEYMARGAIPKELLGITGKAYGSQFGAAAHSAEQLNRIDRMVNNSVDDEMVFTVKGRDGKAKTAPFEFGGTVVRPDKDGNVRITDQGKIDIIRQIDAHRKQRTNEIMEIVRLGDDIASYVFGMDPTTWENYCKVNGPVPAGVKMHDDLKKLDCTVAYINSLPPSLTQTQSVAKLRKLTEHFEKNVNIENLSSVADAKSNMSDGHNVLDVKKPENHPYSKAVTDATGAVTGWEAPTV
jgi:hypothetical protein